MNDQMTPDAEAEYIGWIPCLAGELLYSHTEPGLGEYDVIVVNFLGFSSDTTPRKVRYIAASSVYDWKDSGDTDETGVFRVVVLATTQPGDTTLLQGNLFFISEISRQTPSGGRNMPSRCHNEEELVSRLKFIAQENDQIQRSILKRGLVAAHNDLQRLQTHLGGFRDDATVTVAELIDKIENKHVHRVRFTLDHCGFCRLTYIGLKDPFSSQYDLPSLPPKSPLRDLRLKQQRATLCRQAFYYLKFLFHKHAHHDPSNDSLATTHSNQGACYTTARSLLHDLKSALIDIKRADRQENTGFAGIATYGKSLVTSCYKVGFFDDCADPAKEYRTQHEYFDQLSQSVRLLHERYKPDRERRRQRLSTLQQLLAAVFLFLTPLILVGKSIVSPIGTADYGLTSSLTGYLGYLVARLSHGDVSLLLKIYAIMFGTAFALHHLLIDSKAKVFRTSRSFFDRFRIRAFSVPRCRNDWAEILVWHLYKPVVAIRRLLRGMEYSKGKEHELGPIVVVLVLIIGGSTLLAVSLRALLGGS